MNIGDRVKQLRIKKGMTQEELANRLGYKSKTSVAHIENGNRDIPRSVIVQLANILDTTPSYLMGWTEETTRQSLKQYIQSKQASQDSKDNDLFIEYLIKHYINRINEETHAQTHELSQKIKALGIESGDFSKQLTIKTVETWLDIFDNLTQENRDKLQEQAELLLLKQAQADKTGK